MADVDDTHAPVPQHVDDAEQVFHLLLGQGGSGLVKDDDLGIVGNRLGDLHHLPLGNRQGAHDAVGVHVDLQFLEDPHGLLIHLALVHHDAAHQRVAAQPQVIHNAALERLVQFLVHHGHTVFQRFFTGLEVDLAALQLDGAAVFGIDAEQAFHQRGFARAVLPHQGMDGALADGKGNVVQGLDAGEGFGDVAHLEQNLFTHAYPSFSLK